MILGIGIDLLENARLARALSRHGERFAVKVFTPHELAYCAGRQNRVEALAARFAAKEACLKALGTGWAQGLAFGQVEVERGPEGRPRLRLHGAARDRARALGVTDLWISMTHQPGVSAAVVVLESNAAGSSSTERALRGTAGVDDS